MSINCKSPMMTDDSQQLDVFSLPKQVMTVTEFNSVIKEVVKSLGNFRVKGEITEFRISPNKGLYITLSDGKSNVQVGGFAPAVKGLDFIEKDMDVVVEGIADLYVPYGKFSLNAYSIQPVGEGSLAIAYEKLKQKLANEGLFADGHKQELPDMITKIALITGDKSAAFSDFVKILKEHRVRATVYFFPALVQGKQSVESLSASLQSAQQTDADVIILTRGGGSLEDLKSFNDEELARLVFASAKPIIAGVGHERDESICDFVADLRASTPSQAAYYIASQNQEFLQGVVEIGDGLHSKLQDFSGERLRKTESLFQELLHAVKRRIDPIQTKLETTTKLLESYIQQKMQNVESTLEIYERALSAMDVHNTLKRGFAILQKDGKGITSISEIDIRSNVETLMHDGKFISTVNKLTPYTISHDKEAPEKKSKTVD